MANTQQYDLNQKIKEEVKRLVEGRTINECILQTQECISKTQGCVDWMFIDNCDEALDIFIDFVDEDTWIHKDLYSTALQVKFN